MKIYPMISKFSIADYCCGDRKANCPRCDTELCVFCEDTCPGCDRSVF